MDMDIDLDFKDDREDAAKRASMLDDESSMAMEPSLAARAEELDTVMEDLAMPSQQAVEPSSKSEVILNLDHSLL